ncbi:MULTISPECIES: META domain-containing protein [Halomonadaceae]|uniref:Heat shock protein HslJ n=1 Tax=Onishia taeanensis TaxID=284577 RepID=A0A328XYE9_9GAMM|nr:MULTISPECIES: META domain-containing protein [Halomonas]RAR60897.1 heat shock protein HslJ [Halomonas taeanensis]
MRKGWLMAVVLAGLLAGCSSAPAPTYDQGSAETTAASPVVGPRWNLLLLGTSERWTHPDTPYFEVVRQGGQLRLVGSNGCNRISGALSLESGNRFSVENLASTRMACANGNDAQRVDAMLNGAYRYLIDHDRLVLFGRDSRVLGGFKRAN